MGKVIGRIGPRCEPTYVLDEATYHMVTGAVPRASTVIVIAATPEDEDGMRGLYVWTGGAETDEKSIQDVLDAAIDYEDYDYMGRD
jgi:hypothetical protein